MQIPYKKILIVLGFVVVVVGIGFLIYFLFFKPAVSPPETEEPGVITVGQLPSGTPPTDLTPEEKQAIFQKTSEKITKIPAEAEADQIDQVAQGGLTKTTTLTYDTTPTYKIASAGNLHTYNSDTGNFYKLSHDGTKQLLTNKVYKNVKNLDWSPNDKEAILEFPDGSNILFNFEKDVQVTLPKSWTDFDFNPSGNKIIFKDLDENPEYNWLAVANPDGSGQSYIDHIGNKKHLIINEWSPNNQVVGLFKAEGTGVTTEIQMIGQGDDKFQSFNAKGFGFKPQWSPTGDKILYSAYSVASNMDAYLYVVDTSPGTIGYNHKKINLKTWADKCTFANNSTVYCGVPKDLPEAAGPVPEIADNTPDYVYKIDLDSGQTSFIAELEYNHAMDNLHVSDDGKYLYYTDKQTQSLHYIQLK